MRWHFWIGVLAVVVPPLFLSYEVMGVYGRCVPAMTDANLFWWAVGFFVFVLGLGWMIASAKYERGEV